MLPIFPLLHIRQNRFQAQHRRQSWYIFGLRNFVNWTNISASSTDSSVLRNLCTENSHGDVTNQSKHYCEDYHSRRSTIHHHSASVISLDSKWSHRVSWWFHDWHRPSWHLAWSICLFVYHPGRIEERSRSFADSPANNIWVNPN